MSKIILVTGGARSGKSTFAENKVKEMGQQIGYIATAKVTDADMAKRIEHHKQSRPSEWPTFELYQDFEVLSKDDAFTRCDTLILDCVTIMITNIMFDTETDYDNCSPDRIMVVEAVVKEQVTRLLEFFRNSKKNLVLVSNEVGLGLVPPYRLGNVFRDIAGRMNQLIAREADEAYFIVSGLPMKLK